MTASEDTVATVELAGERFFEQADEVLHDVPHRGFQPEDLAFYWDKLPAHLQKAGEKVRRDMLELGKVVARTGRVSALVDEADLRELGLALKAARSALRLREFYYRAPDAIHDEGTVLGYSPPEQGERWPRPPARAVFAFRKAITELKSILEIADASDTTGRVYLPEPGSVRYRSNTAFLMMWMSDERPELDDVRDTVKSVFSEFGINAVRADEIEHSDVITQRILDAIVTSEILFADLTGSRPSVYYEVGYAHALGKRVILFRSAETDIHFDLAGYNCPTYKNLAELRKKLRKRLAAVTGQASEGEE